MRIRFFAIIGVVLFVVAIVSAQLHALLVKEERIGQIDEQVRETATALLDSSLAEVRTVDFNTIDELISEELGESRIGKFFIIRNERGETLFESNTAQVLPILDVPQDPQWVTINEKGRFIRVLNLKLPRINDRTLQVGLVIEDELLSPNFWSIRNLIFVLTIVAFGLGVAWLLTSALLRPIEELERFFSQKMDRGYQLSRIWAYQMAHELKTPAALLSIDVENGVAQKKIDREIGESLQTGIERINETVSSFLGWAELENAPSNETLHVVKLAAVAKEALVFLESQGPGRLGIEVTGDFQAMADPQKLRFLIRNLLSNALKYSSGPVRLHVGDRVLTVEDSGPGIPSSVLERLGEPFNKGEKGRGGTQGHGLGLAWVMSVAKRYGWAVDIDTSPRGTKIHVRFPSLED